MQHHVSPLSRIGDRAKREQLVLIRWNEKSNCESCKIFSNDRMDRKHISWLLRGFHWRDNPVIVLLEWFYVQGIIVRARLPHIQALFSVVLPTAWRRDKSKGVVGKQIHIVITSHTHSVNLDIMWLVPCFACLWNLLAFIFKDLPSTITWHAEVFKHIVFRQTGWGGGGYCTSIMHCWRRYWTPSV